MLYTTKTPGTAPRRIEAASTQEAAQIAERDSEGAAQVMCLRDRFGAGGTQAKAVADHIEQRLRTWRQQRMNRSGDRLALDDFMGEDSITDLVDFVCDEYELDAVLRPRCRAAHVCDCQEAGTPCARGFGHPETTEWPIPKGESK